MSEINSPFSNIPQLSVSDISDAIKKLLEGNFSRVCVRGEVTEVKYYPSGHVYFSLKDEGGKISAVIWKSALGRLSVKPENGMEVLATGKVSSYGGRSNYQLMVDRMEFAGEGALLARIEQLKQKLRAEGLFSAERKKPLPFLPRQIGVITSSSGAVLHDICTTIERRFPSEILLYPVKVQGEGAVESLIKAVRYFSALENPPEILIMARGGGSLEDLMAFNDEALLREVALCHIPLISAIGHETDTTLIDFISDKRAPTPTAAAEMAVPLRESLRETLFHHHGALRTAWTNFFQNRSVFVERIAASLPNLPSLLDTAKMQLDERSERLESGLPRFIEVMKTGFSSSRYALPNLATLLSHNKHVLERAVAQMESGWKNFYQQKSLSLAHYPFKEEMIRGKISLSQTRLEGIGKNLEAVSPRAVLERGYVFVQDEKTGKALTHQSLLSQEHLIRLNFVDGVRRARLLPESVDEGKPS